MGKYIKKFSTHTQYGTYINSQNRVLPNVSLCEQEDELHYNPYSYAEDYLTFVALEDGTFTFTPQSSNVISYSTNGGDTWTQGNSVSVDSGDKVLWRGTMTPASNNGIGTFSATGNFDVQGNIMSLLFGDNYKGQISLSGKSYAFYKLFDSNTNVVNAKNLSLPATTLEQYCYNRMFSGCTNLITAPELPATTLAENCYNSMFKQCSSLTTAPELPATTLAYGCYSSMFYGCTNLVTTPELPATTLANGCYNAMFYNCSSLVSTPELPATTLIQGCYGNMFRNCTSLTTVSGLPAETLVPHCYDSMFYGCTNLNYIKAMFTTTPSGSSPNFYTTDWVNGVSATGTFVKNMSATWNVSGNSGIPNGWTVQTASN